MYISQHSAHLNSRNVVLNFQGYQFIFLISYEIQNILFKKCYIYINIYIYLFMYLFGFPGS